MKSNSNVLFFSFQVVVPGCEANLLKVNIRDFLNPTPHLGHEVEMKIARYRENKFSEDQEKSLRQ